MTPLPPAIALSAALAIAAGLGILPAFVLFVAKPLTTVLLIVHAARRGRRRAGGAALDPGRPRALAGAATWRCCGRSKASCPAWSPSCSRTSPTSWRSTLGVRFAARWRRSRSMRWSLPSCSPCSGPACRRRCACRCCSTWSAWRRWRRRRRSSGCRCAAPPSERLAWSGAIGGALFMLSDALLATNKFATPLPLASLWCSPPTGRRSGASRARCAQPAAALTCP